MKESFEFFLEEQIKKEYPSEYAIQIIDGYKQKRNTTLRVNTIKSNITKIIEVLTENNIKFNKIDWCEDALILDEEQEKNVKALDIFKNGEIYLQSLSSMLPSIILDPKPKENILDMCAAPGGKTTQISALADNQAYITACERNTIRLERLKHNINIQGCRGVSVINRDSRDLDDYLKFDKILLDAPCSGSGTISLHEYNNNYNLNNDIINKHTKTQNLLLKKAIRLLRPEGIIVYSTCSILREENEEIIENALKQENVEIIPITTFKDIPQLPVTINGTICVMPSKKYEGFFVAKLKKKS